MSHYGVHCYKLGESELLLRNKKSGESAYLDSVGFLNCGLSCNLLSAKL